METWFGVEYGLVAVSIGVQMEAIIELNPVRWRTDAPQHIVYADDRVLVLSTVTG